MADQLISSRGRLVVPVELHPILETFLARLAQKNGRSLRAEIIEIVGTAMDAAELPPEPTNAPFQREESLMAERAECEDCGQLIRHHAQVWARRHVSMTGHSVNVTLYHEVRDRDWLAKLSTERDEQITAEQKGEVAQGVVLSIVSGRRK